MAERGIQLDFFDQGMQSSQPRSIEKKEIPMEIPGLRCIKNYAISSFGNGKVWVN